MVADLDAVDVAGGAGNVGDDGLLLARQGVKQVTFADVWPADQGDANDVVRRGVGGWRNEIGNVVEQLRDADVVIGRGFDDGFDAETLEFIGVERAFEVSFIGDEEDGLAAFEGLFGELAIGV